ncbi:MAG TPA: ribosome small subunit-dependent GTPase A [Longimicrobiales bacterium]|nr:ribosome small subunit-dependent GTPase A [Longimicrobiales bacterium]
MKDSPPAVAQHPGRVLEAAGGVYDIRLDTGEVVQASLRGRLKLESRTGDKVVAGDEVRVARDDIGGATIEAVSPRRSEIARRAPGRSRGAKVIVANPDRLVAVFALSRPAPSPRLLDRFLVTAEVNRLPSVIVANKSDLPEAADAVSLFEPYPAAGYTVIRTSVKAGQGLDELRALLCDGTSVVAGPSGVGKSSLLNAIEPGLSLRIGEVSEVVGKGRHTTVTSRLIPLGCGGYVADTPGIRELGLWQVDQAMLADAFPEFREPAESCRFAPSCSHSHEPGCGVLDGVSEGSIAASRHESYLALLEEIREADRKRW